VVHALRAQGVETVFGYPGGAIMPVYDALYDGGVEHLLCRHEQGAVIAAIGYARATGKTGVCIATSGPGATNLITGLADAMLDSVPVVALTGQVGSALIGTDAENLMNTWLAAKKEVSLTAQHNQLSIGASASLWECMLTSWLSSLYQQHNDSQYEARIASRQSLVKQLHDRRLDLLLTTEAPKMDEFSSQLLGHFDLALYAGSPECHRDTLTYLRIEWGADFQQRV